MILRKAEGLLTGVPSLEKRTGYIKTIINGAVKIFPAFFIFVTLGYSSETGNKHKTIIFGPVRNVPFLSIII